MEPAHDAVAIRSATEADARSIACVHVMAWRATYTGLLPASVISAQTVEARAAMWQDALRSPAPDRTALVAEAPAGITGFASGGPARVEVAGFTSEVYALYLLPAWQRRGLGRRLLSALAARLVASGYANVYLWVLAENSSSRRFYEAVGGHEIATRDEQMGCAMVPEVAYGWPDLMRLAGQ